MRKLLLGFILISVSYIANSQVNPGTIGSDQTLCYGTAPQVLTFTVPPSGGTSYTFLWQRSSDGLNFSDITGRSAGYATFSPPVVGSTTWFRCSVKDAILPMVYTNQIMISVRPVVSPGVIGYAQTIPTGSIPSALVELQSASGGGNSLSYQWQSSTNESTWSDIAGANSTTYSPPALNSTTWYRRVVADGICAYTTSSLPIRINVISLISVYTTEQPTNYPYSEDVNYELGTEFMANRDGIIPRIRFYTSATQYGTHVIRFYRATGFRMPNELLAGPITLEIDIEDRREGWHEYILPSPVQVNAGQSYIVTVALQYWRHEYAQIYNYVPASSNEYISFVRGRTHNLPSNTFLEYTDEGFFRDVVFVPFSPGTAGTNQTLCYNTIPLPLTQITTPSGATGTYTYQWQRSSDGLSWTDIQWATSPSYSPPPLTASTHFRRSVTSGGYTVYSSPVLITMNSQISLAQLNGSKTIYQNTSTFFNVTITGGTPPYTIEYSRNGTAQAPVLSYASGTDIYTGTLATGSYTYSLTNVTDSRGCSADSLGTSITINVSGSPASTVSNKIIVLVNSTSGWRYFPEFNLVKQFLDWFGMPYEVVNLGIESLPNLNEYALIMFGHRNVYHESYPEGQQNYPYSALEAAIAGGVGLYSLDPHLFDFPSAFNIAGAAHPTVTSSQININAGHFITQLHANDIHNPTNNILTIPDTYGIGYTTIPSTSFSLTGTVTDLATLSSSEGTEALIQSTTFGSGRIVKWSEYNCLAPDMGALRGMDDIIWRGIVWAARKPFVMQGIPPMITMRVDDVDGTGGSNIENDFEWLKICNEYGLIPWCGTFNNTIPTGSIPTLRGLINSNKTTASPHAFSESSSDIGFIYWSDDNDPEFTASENVIAARNFYTSNQLTMSKYLVPHFYGLSSSALPEIRNMGIEYIGTKIPYDRYNPGNYPGNQLQIGPYSRFLEEFAGHNKPYFYADSVNWLGNSFFITLTEIGDDGGYEWYPDQGTTGEIISRGVRHLRRALNGMLLPVLFTHEYHLTNITATNWRQILSQVTTEVSSYTPEYRSMDYAVQYLRAKKNITITGVTDHPDLVNISCMGVNDMDTRCYLFTETNNEISYRLVSIPRVTSSSTPVTVAVTK